MKSKKLNKRHIALDKLKKYNLKYLCIGLKNTLFVIELE